MNNNNNFYFDPHKPVGEQFKEYRLSNKSNNSIKDFISVLPNHILFPAVSDTLPRDFPVFCADEDIIRFISEFPESAWKIKNNQPHIPNVVVEYVERINSTTLLFKINGHIVEIACNVKGSVNETSIEEIRQAILKDAPAIFSFGTVSETFKYGPKAALKILFSAFPTETYIYFIVKSIEHYLSPGKNCAVSLFKQLNGAHVHFSYYSNVTAELIKVYHLHSVIGDNLDGFKKSALDYLRTTSDRFATIKKEFVIEYAGPTNNNTGCIFLVNGKEISIANNNPEFKNVTTLDIYNLCSGLQHTVNNDGPLDEFVKKYGHRIVFSILEIISFEDTIAFFKNRIIDLFSQRCVVHFRELLKDVYGFRSTAANKKFLNILLDLFDEMEKEYTDYLISINHTELNKSDSWTMFYMQNKTLCCYLFNFKSIKNQSIRAEFLLFMREFFNNNHLNKTSSIYARIITALVYIPEDISSITKITKSDVINIILLMKSHLKSQTIYKNICSCAIFYDYISSLKNNTKRNPFKNAKLIDDTENVVPPDVNDIITLLKHSEKTSPHIKLAFMMLLETGGRAKEITTLTLDDIEIRDEIISTRTLFKTSNVENHLPFVRNTISKELSVMLKKFINDTQYIRNKFDKPYIFVYKDNTKRKDGSKQFKVLNSTVFYYRLKKWANAAIGKEKSKNITLQSIRPFVATELHKYGYSASQISDVLGNTPEIAEEHYINLSPSDEANIRNKFFETTFNHVFENNLSSTAPSTNTTLLGSCVSQMKCNKGNDCSVCEHRISCSKTI